MFKEKAKPTLNYLIFGFAEIACGYDLGDQA